MTRFCPLVTEAVLSSIEGSGKRGLSSQEILAIFAEHGVAFSEATLRKYVQLGLLPRSVRVGEKGKHRGSRGLYPLRVVRQILLIKQLLSENHTISEIKDEFLFLASELDDLEGNLETIFAKIGQRTTEREARGLVTEARDAEGVGRDLLQRLRRVEERLRTRLRLSVVSGQ